MLKFLFMMSMMIPMFMFKKLWMYFQFLFFLMSFLYLLSANYVMDFSKLSTNMGQDFLSYGLILLSFWICGLMIMSSEKINYSNFFNEKFIFMILMLMFLLYLTFSSMNLFSFYLYFEGSLIPTLLLILGWGYQPERVQAGIYMLFYTLLASMPLLLTIFYIYKYMGNITFYMLSEIDEGVFIYLGLLMAFLVKLPMFLTHLWLPKAHVEAPVSGSMILAGVLLKLGGYGLLRNLPLVLKIGMQMNLIWIIISLVGGGLISLVCLRQEDMKSLIAYSSVSHMGIMLSGLMTYVCWGYNGAFMMMIAHGLCSSGLFALSNIVYERMGTRSMIISKGLLHIMPIMSLWWFMFCIMNMGAPPSMNLMSEIGLINSLMYYSYWSMLSVGIMSFLGASYSLYLFSRSQHGIYMNGLYSFIINDVREYMIMFFHWLPLNLVVLNSLLFYVWI